MPPLDEVPEVVTTTTTSSSSPTKSPLFLSSPDRKSPEKVQNGKSSCGCLCKCNGGGVCVSRTCLQISSSGGSAISDKKGNLGVPPKVSTNSSSNHSQTLKETISVPPLILRLPIPVLNITPKDSQPVSEKSVAEKVKEEEEVKTLDDVEEKVLPPPEEVDPPTLSSNKRKRKRRRKYPYVVRKPVKKRRVAYDELNVESSSAPITSELDTTEIGGLSPELSPAAEAEVTLITPPIVAFTSSPPTTQKPKRVQNIIKPKAKLGRPPKSKSKPKPRPKHVKLTPGRKSKSKLNGLSPSSSLPVIQSQPLLLSSSSSSDDPYVFIPDEFDDFEPVPKLFSPKSGRKNGLCSPNNGFVSVPSSSPTILSVPLSSLSPTRLNQPLISPSAPPTIPPKKEKEPPKIEVPIASPPPPPTIPVKKEKEPPKIEAPIASPPPPPKEESSNPTTTTTSLSSELKKKTKRKRKNEVCQLLQWAIISPRPSTPRSTLITAFLPKESATKDATKDQSSPSASLTSPSTIPLPPPPPPPPPISDITPPSNEEKKKGDKETFVQSSTSIAHAAEDRATQHRDDDTTPLAQLLEKDKLKEVVQEEIKEDKAVVDLDKDGVVLINNDSMPLPFVRVPWGGRRGKGKVVKRKRKKRSELHYKKSKKSKISNSNKSCVQHKEISNLLREKEEVKAGESGNVNEKGRVLSPKKLGKPLSTMDKDHTPNLREDAEKIIKLEDVVDNDAGVITKCESSIKGKIYSLNILICVTYM